MAPEYAMALIGFVFSVLALPALLWALARRRERSEIRASDAAMYGVLEDGEADFSAAPAVSPRRARWLLAALVGVFLMIAVSVVVTILVASGKPVPGVTVPSGKCPI